MTLQSVQAHARAVSVARDATRVAELALQAECRVAVAEGIPKAHVARAAGVTRATLYSWIGEAK